MGEFSELTNAANTFSIVPSTLLALSKYHQGPQPPKQMKEKNQQSYTSLNNGEKKFILIGIISIFLKGSLCLSSHSDV